MKKLLTFFLLFSSYVLFACECENKVNLDVRDWNDSDVIFSAVLSQYSETLKFKKLTFSISTVYKGKVQKKTIQFYISNITNHLALHHVKKISVGQNWIVFASKLMRNNSEYFKLVEGDKDGYCMLTKPIAKDDNYLSFIKQVKKTPFLKDHSFLKDKKIIAKGSLENLIPIGKWKYFNSANDYWEGDYNRGKKNGKWLHKASNFKKETVVIGLERYKDGKIKERIEYNYVGQKRLQEIYSDTIKKRIFYNNRFVSRIWIVNTIKRNTLIQTYKNGKLSDEYEENRILF